jgi:hypothetical protein
VNTFELQRAIRDAAPLSKSERVVLIMATTYLPNACPSWRSLALDTGLHRDTVRRAAYALRDKGLIKLTPKGNETTTWAFDAEALAKLPRTPKIKGGVIPDHRGGGISDHRGCDPRSQGGGISDHTEETRKRQPKPTTINEARERLGEWTEVWDKVIGHGPLPSLEELRRWRPKVTEAHISACLGEVANARTAGTVNAPRSLFFHRLKNTIGQPTPTAWSKAQVLAALRPATATSAPDLRRPELQTPDVPPPFTETPEERQARLKVSRAALEAMRAAMTETSKND